MQQVVNGYPRVRHLLLVIFHLLVSTLPSITAPADPTIIEQPEGINNTPIVINYIACGGQQLPTINSPAAIYKHVSRKSCEGGLGVTAARYYMILLTTQVKPVWMENTFVH